MRLHVKMLLILLYLVSGYSILLDRVASLGASVELAYYLCLLFLLTACLVAAALVENVALRGFYALALFGSAVFLRSVESATGEHLTYDAFVNLLYSRGFVGDALRQYGGAIVPAMLAGLPLLLGIMLSPGPRLRLPRRAYIAAPLAGTALLALILFVRGGDGARGLPGAFTPLAYGSLLAYETGAAGDSTRQAVSLPMRGRPSRRDIVLIVDESVLGTYLDLNRRDGVRSGLNAPRPGLAIHNFGYAAAITNCSVGTNVTLRHGGTREDYRRIDTVMPSIWAYSRHAGLRTVYIDAQRTGGSLQNLMDEQERAEIDLFIQFDDVPVRDRDMAAADRLATLLEDDRADFILVNKIGAHFPVHDKYPDDFMRYRPALSRGRFDDIADTGDRDQFDGTAQDWRRYRNAYRNTLLWNVGAFFDRLLARTDLSGAVLIYTSDHGQDLHEHGEPGVTTHCRSEPIDEEGLVPLVVVENAAARVPDWRAQLDHNRDRSSHYGIFPTLLELMGYAPAAVRAAYGPPLFEPSRDSFTFNSRFNARLGHEPLWRHIEVDRLAPAPSSEGGGW